MTGPGSGQPSRATLLADANVLIDYSKSGDLGILSLVADRLGPLVVVSTVLDEVRELEADDCARLGIEIVEATTEQQIRAASIEARASFNDRVCLVVCLDERWTCVTNDPGSSAALPRARGLHPFRAGSPGGSGRGRGDHSGTSRSCRAPDSGPESAAHQRPRTGWFSGGARSSPGELTRAHRAFTGLWPRGSGQAEFFAEEFVRGAAAEWVSLPSGG